MKAEVKAEDDKAADVKTEVCLCHSWSLCKHACVSLYNVNITGVCALLLVCIKVLHLPSTLTNYMGATDGNCLHSLLGKA